MKVKMLRNYLILLIAIIVYSCQSSANIEIVETYPDGSTKTEVILKDVEAGNFTVQKYFTNGSLEVSSEHVGFIKHGQVKVFYENGGIREEHTYKKGAKVGVSNIYDEQGRLIEKQKYNEKGFLTYYKKYDANGRQIINPYSRMPIVIPEKDTIRLGEAYKAEITLGNRYHDKVEVYVGTLEYDPMKYRDKKLLNKNDSTAIYKFHPQDTGTYKIEGLVIDIPNFKNDNDTITAVWIRFSHTYTVVP
jgi:hypothetical protein